MNLGLSNGKTKTTLDTGAWSLWVAHNTFDEYGEVELEGAAMIMGALQMSWVRLNDCLFLRTEFLIVGPGFAKYTLQHLDRALFFLRILSSRLV